ncbi:MAG: hypothetical protein H6625_01650 [Bdellovibrionaceae bacterium]|nr:hypothetical protein [Pseudobdellovibrionaceae bacterium]
MQTQIYSHDELKNIYPSTSSVSEIIADFELQCWEKGSVICEIHLNGIYISEEEEKNLSKKTINDVNTLEILTRDQTELIEVTLRTMNQWIPKIRDRSRELSTFYKIQKEVISADDFIELIDGCKWLSDSLHLLKPTLLKLVNNPEFEEKWTQSELIFTSTAKEVLSSFEKQDMVLLSDILEYDLSDSLDQWQDLLFSQSTIRTLAKV